MRSILRHALRSGCTADAVDDLDAIATPEVAALCRSAADAELPPVEQLRALKALDQRGLSFCSFSDRPDATHCLMTLHGVYLLKL